MAIMVLLLIFQVVVFAFELLVVFVFNDIYAKSTSTSATVFRHMVGPVSVGIVGAIILPIALAGQENELLNSGQVCGTNLDGDIGGDGVRISIWTQEAVLLFIALIGSFHPFDSGAKEVGAGLVITHVSLTCALLVGLGRQTLTSVDAAVGSMILDAQNLALSIQLAMKATLASRLQVWIVVLSQTLGLIALPIFMVGLDRGLFATEGCTCFSVFWLARLTDCPAANSSDEVTIFWVYYVFRCTLFLQSSFHSVRNANKFDLADLEERTHPEDRKNTRLAPHKDPCDLKDITFPKPLFSPKTGETIKYKDYPATATSSYAVSGTFAFISMATAEITIKDFSLLDGFQGYSTGQIIAMVVAGATVLRAAYLFWEMFHNNSNSWKEWRKGRWNNDALGHDASDHNSPNGTTHSDPSDPLTKDDKTHQDHPGSGIGNQVGRGNMEANSAREQGWGSPPLLCRKANVEKNFPSTGKSPGQFQKQGNQLVSKRQLPSTKKTLIINQQQRSQQLHQYLTPMKNRRI
jgi:hypothetical protein